MRSEELISDYISFCFAGEYIYFREYVLENKHHKCWFAKIDDGKFRIIETELEIHSIQYLKHRKKYAILIEEGKKAFKAIFAKNLDTIDFNNNIMQLPEAESWAIEFIDTPSSLYLKTESKVYEIGEKITQIIKRKKNYHRYSGLLELDSDKLLVKFDNDLNLYSKKRKRIKKRFYEIPQRSSWGFLSNGTIVYYDTIFTTKRDNFEINLYFINMITKYRKIIVLPYMEQNELYIDEDIIYIKRVDSYYGKYDDLQIYNFNTHEYLRLKNGNFYSCIDDLHFHENFIYLRIDYTIYKIDKVEFLQYYEKVDDSSKKRSK